MDFMLMRCLHEGGGGRPSKGHLRPTAAVARGGRTVPWTVLDAHASGARGRRQSSAEQQGALADIYGCGNEPRRAAKLAKPKPGPRHGIASWRVRLRAGRRCPRWCAHPAPPPWGHGILHDFARFASARALWQQAFRNIPCVLPAGSLVRVINRQIALLWRQGRIFFVYRREARGGSLGWLTINADNEWFIAVLDLLDAAPPT